MTFVRDQLPDPVEYFTEQGFSLAGQGKWRSMACPFHGSSDSMRVNTERGSWVCMAACGARGGDVIAFHQALHGVSFVEAVKALGAWVEDPPGSRSLRRRPTPFAPHDALEVAANELMLVTVAALNVHHGVALTEQDRARLLLGASRLHAIAAWLETSK